MFFDIRGDKMTTIEANIEGQNVILKFAQLTDKRKSYEMLISPETQKFMFDEKHPAPTWEEFNEEDDSYYSGKASKDGCYLFIEYKGDVIGSISYACEYEKIPYAELDIWMKSTAYTGKGLGTESINILIDFIHKTYHVNHFLIRPWRKNINAISAYKKCGFNEEINFKTEDYYSEENLRKCGEGDYGIAETMNLVKRIEDDNNA